MVKYIKKLKPKFWMFQGQCDLQDQGQGFQVSSSGGGGGIICDTMISTVTGAFTEFIKINSFINKNYFDEHLY